MTLTTKRKVFIEEYLKCWNATEAARRATYKHPNVQGPTLVNLPEIWAAIESVLVEMKVKRTDIPKKIIHRRHSKTRFIYLIREEHGLVKIGKTNDVSRRLIALDGACPYVLTLIGFVETNQAHKLEADLHKRYADKRVKGEWFALSDKDVRGILNDALT